MSLSGSILRSDNFAPVAGVTVTLRPGGATAITDAAGNFVFDPAPGFDTYTATPTLAGYVFTPESETFVYDKALGLSFAALPAPTPDPAVRSTRTWRDVFSVRVDAHPAGPVTPVLAVANRRYTTHPDDEPANLDFAPWLQSISATAAIAWWPWGGASIAQPLGQIVATNRNGVLDWTLAEDWRDRRIDVRNGSTRDAYGSHQVLASAYIDRVEADPAVLRLRLRAVAEYLALRLSTRYSSANAQIDQRPRPITLGAACWVRPVLVDPDLHRYDVADAAYHSAVAYDDGVIAPSTPTPTGFQLFSAPSGDLIARVTGQTIDGLQTDTLGRFVRWIVQRYTPPIPLDAASLDAVSAVAGTLAWTSGGSEVDGLSLLGLALDTVGAAAFEGMDGALHFRRISDPWTAVDPQPINGRVSGVSIELDRAPGLSTAAEIANNPGAGGVPPGGYPSADPAINDSLSRDVIRIEYSGAALHRTYASEASLRTARRIIAADAAAAQTELNRVVGMYTRRWWFFRFRIDGADPVQPGDVRILQFPRYGLAGGIPVMIVSARAGVVGIAVYDVIAWGTFTPP